MYQDLFKIAKKYGDTCEGCDDICCMNMVLELSREDVKNMAKSKNISREDFRKKYTILSKNWAKKSQTNVFHRGGTVGSEFSNAPFRL
jgi:hypothetical protein